MRRPNLWVALPVAVAGIAGGVIGYFVTDASCAPGGCLIAAIFFALLAGLAAAVGIGVVVVLAVRSMTEWREMEEREITIEMDQAAPGLLDGAEDE
jgi:predicted lipid-binding transport protein (Tim44 family)